MAKQSAWSSAVAVLSILRALRMPLIVGLFAGIALALPPQSHEIYRAISQGLALWPLTKEEITELLGCIVAILILTATTIAANRTLLHHFWGELPEQARELPGAVRALSAFVVTIPWIGLAVGLFNAQVPLEPKLQSVLRTEFVDQLLEYTPIDHSTAVKIADDRLPAFFKFNDWLVIFSGSILALAIVLVAIGYWLGAPRLPAAGRDPDKRTGNWVFVLGLIAAIVIGVGAVIVATYIPTVAGPFAVICSFFTVLMIVTSSFSFLADRYGIPLVSIFVTAAFLFAFLQWNDNHQIRLLPTTGGTKPKAESKTVELPKVREAFYTWLRNRPDLQLYRDRGLPYPVYLVAAQGGGIYAAQHAASVLGTLQDECQAFSTHLFAVSGVSGGSIGAAAFSSMLRSVKPDYDFGTCDRREKLVFSYAEATEQYFSRDLLSSLIASLLFPDFLQRFLPRPVPSFDRASAHEQYMERAYTAITDGLKTHHRFPVPIDEGNPLKKSYLLHWQADGWGPALLFNTTDVKTGRRRIIAPFNFTSRDNVDLPARVAGNISLMTAANLSARFPWIAPAGWYRADNGQKVRLVDGGYFENSGMTTMQELIDEIVTPASGQIAKLAEIPFTFRVIALASTGFKTSEASYLEEFLSPVRALLNTQSARAELAIETSEKRASATPKCRSGKELSACHAGSVSVYRVAVRGYGYDLPLGWRLSRVTRYLVRAHEGNYTKCQQSIVPGTELEDQPLMNSCVNAIVFKDLNLAR